MFICWFSFDFWGQHSSLTCRYKKKIFKRWVYFGPLIFHTSAFCSEALNNFWSRGVSVVQINEWATVQVVIETLHYAVCYVLFTAPRAPIADAIEITVRYVHINALSGRAAQRLS